jgi:hypothetical protein
MVSYGVVGSFQKHNGRSLALEDARQKLIEQNAMSPILCLLKSSNFQFCHDSINAIKVFSKYGWLIYLLGFCSYCIDSLPDLLRAEAIKQGAVPHLLGLLDDSKPALVDSVLSVVAELTAHSKSPISTSIFDIFLRALNQRRQLHDISTKWGCRKAIAYTRK